MTAHVSSNEVVHEWHGEWASLDDLHTRAKVKSLLETSNALVLRGGVERKNMPPEVPSRDSFVRITIQFHGTR